MPPYIPKPKLLLVDSDEANRLIVKEILGATNIVTIEALNYREAFSLFTQHPKEIGLVIIDIILPDGDGILLLNQIHRIDPLVPAIALSAIEPAILAQKCKNTGFNACISKPFNLDGLMGVIVSYMLSSISVMKEH